MHRRSFEDMNCSIARSLEQVGEWWTLLIVRDLFTNGGLHRFDEIQADLGIARNMLTDRLTGLVEHGIVERRLYQSHPERYEYHLTRKGRDLFPVLMALMAWGDEYADWDAGPPMILHHTTCEHDTTAIVACKRCGAELTPRDTRVRRTRWLKELDAAS